MTAPAPAPAPVPVPKTLNEKIRDLVASSDIPGFNPDLLPTLLTPYPFSMTWELPLGIRTQDATLRVTYALVPNQDAIPLPEREYKARCALSGPSWGFSPEEAEEYIRHFSRLTALARLIEGLTGRKVQ